MPRTAATSIPTSRQIQETHKTVVSIHPDARISRVGPDGIVFEYPADARKQGSQFEGKPFSAASK